MLDGWFVLPGFVCLILHLQGVVEVPFVSQFGQEAGILNVVGLENLGKAWVGIQGDGGRGSPRGKRENVTDSQFETEFI